MHAMVPIASPRAVTVSARGTRRIGAGEFALPSAAPAAAGPAAAPDAPAGLLALQEREDGPARDRAARQRGRAILDALAALQRDLLAGRLDPAGLERLVAGLDGGEDAADPALRSVLKAVVLRARVELARSAMVAAPRLATPPSPRLATRGIAAD